MKIPWPRRCRIQIDDGETMRDVMGTNVHRVKMQDDGDDGGEPLSKLMVIKEQILKEQDTDDGEGDTRDEDNAKEEAVQEEDDDENLVAMANVDDKLDVDIEQAG